MSNPGAVRARKAFTKVIKHDKYGKPYVGVGETIVSRGMFSAREAERELQKSVDAAESRGERVVDAVVDVYGSRENPEIAGNPRRSTGGAGVWGFEAATFLGESPELRRRQARREQANA